jgi:hypothetical protein
LIRQLSADEAKILAALNGQEYEMVNTRALDRVQNLFYGVINVELDTIPRENPTFSPQHSSPILRPHSHR